MLPGFNHNIRYRERVFHVQTEDNGLSQPVVITQLFLEGHVLAVERLDYADLTTSGLDEATVRETLRERMQEQHKGVLRGLVEGRFDDRLGAFLGAAESDEFEPMSDFDRALPDGVLEAAEELMCAPRELPAQPVPGVTGPRTSVLRPEAVAPSFIDDVSVDGLVDSIEEWVDIDTDSLMADDRRSEPIVPAPRALEPSRPDIGQDTLVDVRLPAALRAAQERLRAQARSASNPRPSLPSSEATVIGRPPVRPPTTIRRVEVHGVRPPAKPPPRPGESAPGEMRSTEQTRPPAPRTPPKGRKPIPGSDVTMLEVDPLALKEAMARQRARLEAQRKAKEDAPASRPDSKVVVSEPSLDEVIMNYLKDQE